MHSDKGQMIDQASCLLSLGSNLGRREKNLVDALMLLNRHGIRVKKCSAIYETEPVDVRNQPDFLNLACQVSTQLEPDELLSECHAVEKRLGRIRFQDRGPRLIDIDILYFGDETIESEYLTIPHPRISERRFVLVPLAEIAPEFVDPQEKKSIQVLLTQCPDNSRITYFKEPPLRRK